MLPETGKISMKDVNVELGKSETSKISLNDSDVRKLAKKDTGIITMNDLHCKGSVEFNDYLKFSGSIDSIACDVEIENFNIIFDGTIINRFYAGYSKMRHPRYRHNINALDGIQRKVNIYFNNDSKATVILNEVPYGNDDYTGVRGLLTICEKYKNQKVNIKIELYEFNEV